MLAKAGGNMRLDANELYLFNNGVNAYAYRALGCHRFSSENGDVHRFAVYAPNARSVSVVGDFNSWDRDNAVMERCGSTGVWEAFLYGVHRLDRYKFAILAENGEWLYKADPFAFYSQLRPDTASVVYELDGYDWSDAEYMSRRAHNNVHSSPMSIYEVHLGSWRHGKTYLELADELVDYVRDLGYTHIELLPVCEHPLDDSWGYQVTGFFSITSRYGTPHDFMYFIDKCHAAGIGVIVDWVGAHFTRDAHGLRMFDGSCVFENPDWRRSEQKQWGTLLFDYGRSEVKSFLISSVMFLFKEFHIDGIRADAVSCMLYHDFARKDGEWIPNVYGGRENLEAIAFLKELASTKNRECRDAILIAEESTSFPKVTGRVEEGGLGFDFKWDMGYMNDTLSYMSLDSIYRRYHHDKLTFSMCYAFSEHFVLAFSHDEVVHGKHTLIGRMCGSYYDKFAQLRLLYMYQYTHPGKKLVFMGQEFGQFAEWDFRKSLDWNLLDYESHRRMLEFSKALNAFYAGESTLYELDDGWDGFRWVSVDDAENSVIAYIRRSRTGREVLCVMNFTPVRRENYPISIGREASFKRLFSSDEERFGGQAAFDGTTCGCVSLGCFEGAVFDITE